MYIQKLCYGKEFWNEIGHSEIWDELIRYLEWWKKDIPEMPSINFDDDAKNTFEEIKYIEVSVFRKIFANKDICDNIIPILSPDNKVLRLLHGYFIEKVNYGSIYKTLAYRIVDIMS